MVEMRKERREDNERGNGGMIEKTRELPVGNTALET